MAPFVSLLALFALALSATVLASPHASRHVYEHAHRAVARAPVDLDSRQPLPAPRRRRSLNKRCTPRPDNSTTSASLSTAAYIAPSPSLASPSFSAPGTSSSPASSYSPPPETSSQAPSPTTTSTPPPPPTTSSAAPPPPTTSSVAPPPPTTSSTPAPSPTSSSTAAPAQTSESSSSSEPSFMTGMQSGDGTYYEVGLGACGVTNSDSQSVVAVSESLFDQYPGYNGVNPNDNPVCGKIITASYNGQSVDLTVVDRCTGCNLTDLDMSPDAFTILAALTVGRIQIQWEWKS